MDLEREMESLAREARKKLEDDQKREAELAKRAGLHVDVGGEDEAGSERVGLATKGLALLGAVTAIWLAWIFIVAPVVKVTITLAVLLAVLTLFFKLIAGGPKP